MAQPDEKRGAGSMIGTEGGLVETAWGFISGGLFGLASPLAGQPFDTIKTRMQVSWWPGPVLIGLSGSNGDGDCLRCTKTMRVLWSS